MRNLSTSRLLFLIHTGGNNILKSPLVKHYNDLINKQSSERSRDEVTYFYVENVFYIFLGTKYANFQEKKIFAEISGRKFQTLYCSNWSHALLKVGLQISQKVICEAKNGATDSLPFMNEIVFCI